jgi:hypothetical protein
MHDIESQRLLARLYTDPGLLSEFLTGRERFVASYGGTNACFLAGIDTAALEYFAGSLVQKRRREVEKLLPWTSYALGEKFESEFRRYAAACLPGGIKKHAADAMAFCRFLRKSPIDVAAKEAAKMEFMALALRFRLVIRRGQVKKCRVTARRTFARLLRFKYDLVARMDERPREGPRERSTIALFLRLPGIRGIWYW